MTEAEWMAANSPGELLETMGDQPSQRKLRLLAVAFCRHIFHLFPNEEARNAVRVVERFADNQTGESDVIAVYNVYTHAQDAPPPNSLTIKDNTARLTSVALRHAASTEASYVDWGEGGFSLARTVVLAGGSAAAAAAWAGKLGPDYHAEFRWQATALRDIFGNPFRPVAVDPAWRTGNVLAIAEGIYDERAFDRMPILADALEDAGCTSAEMLNHCREPTEHVRGCWVVDLVMGKE